MADNFLEKQYADYISKKNAGGSKNTRKSNTPKKEKPKRVFVTGGAQGIGKAIVEAFRNLNHQVAFCDSNKEKGLETARATGAAFFHLDVTCQEELTQCLNQLLCRWGDIDIIINNVGISKFSPIIETSVEQFEQILSTNLTPVFITSRALAIHRELQQEKNLYGRIINLCSTRYLMSEEGTEGYAASKGGIYSLTHSLAISLSKYHITVNSISPGWIENYHYNELSAIDHSQHPSNRVGKPEDIARMCIFLCNEENNFINGENITIDGGMTKKMIYVE